MIPANVDCRLRVEVTNPKAHRLLRAAAVSPSPTVVIHLETLGADNAAAVDKVIKSKRWGHFLAFVRATNSTFTMAEVLSDPTANRFGPSVWITADLDPATVTDEAALVHVRAFQAILADEATAQSAAFEKMCAYFESDAEFYNQPKEREATCHDPELEAYRDETVTRGLEGAARFKEAAAEQKARAERLRALAA